MKNTKSFFQTLDQKTLDFLVDWYHMPIQQVLRNLASADRKRIEKARK